MRRHVVVTTAALPPLLEQPRAALGQPLPSPHLWAQGPRREDVCSLGYADDTQAITLEPRPGVQGIPDSQAVVDRTAVWLADTGQNANAAKSSSWWMSDKQAKPVTLHGVPIPLAWQFKQFGVGVRRCSRSDSRAGPPFCGEWDDCRGSACGKWPLVR